MHLYKVNTFDLNFLTIIFNFIEFAINVVAQEIELLANEDS